MKTILLISPYWKEPHRWMVSSVKLAELWQRLGFRVVVACMGKSDDREQGTEDVSPTLKIYRKKDIFLKDPWNYGIAFGFSAFVRSIIETEKPDHIIVNKILFWTSLSLISLRLRGIKAILLTDALVGMTWWPRHRIPQVCAAMYAWTLGWLIMKCAEKIIFFHPQPDSLLKKLGVTHKSRVIPTGIDSTMYNPGQPENTSYVVITYVGRLESVKGVDDYLHAAVRLKMDHPDLHIQAVGYYVEPDPLVKQYEKDVQFLGLRADIPFILAQTDIFVLPSYSEGLSNALMEAMASGCACIASDVGGNRYLIQNGVSGLLFPAGDREAIIAHIRRLVEDAPKRHMLGNAARERIHKEFDWKTVGEKYQKFFAE